MDKHLKECLDPVAQTIRNGVFNGRVGGAPFADFTSQAASIFTGFEVIAELLQIDLLREGCDDEDDRMLTSRQKDALLGLIRETSRAMGVRVGDIVTWADQRMKEKGAQ